MSPFFSARHTPGLSSATLAASAQTDLQVPQGENPLPDGLTLQQPLHRNGQLPQETLDDGAALGKFVFDFNL